MKNNSVLITGSSKGLGRELALVFADKGYDVILNGRDRKDLLSVKEEVIKKGVKCYILRGDLKYNKTIQWLLKIAREKNILVLINNAAMDCPHLALEGISDKQIENILKTNLIVPVKLTKRIYALFLKKGYGTIININSISGLEGQELRSIYCASKWGLRGFTEAFRLEAKKHNVRVIGVYPGRIRTKPHFTYGMKARDVALKVFNVYKHSDNSEIILDKRHKN